MPRLPRRAIPVEAKCRVAMRQLGYPPHSIDDAVRINDRKLGRLLAGLLPTLASKLECTVAQLRLDHDPALGNRKKIKDKAGKIVGYVPHEHSVEDLLYRSLHGHHIKTHVRGDGAQFSDTVLMKRERRREKRSRKKTGDKSAFAQIRKSAWPKGRKIKSRGFDRRS